MLDMNNLPQVRDVEQVRAVMSLISGEPTTDADLVWFACIGYAESLSECTLKDLANLFAEGVKKVETLGGVQEYIDTYLVDDGESIELSDEYNRDLLAQVARFCGNIELSNQLVGGADEDEE